MSAVDAYDGDGRRLTYTLDGFVQNNLCFRELLVDLGNAIRITGLLVLSDVIFKGRERDGSGRIFCARVTGAEFLDNLADEPISNSGGVRLIGDSDTGNTTLVGVNVEDKF